MKKQIKPDLKALSFLIGTWHTQGEIEGDENAAAIALAGTDSYEWILDKNFILHKVDVKIGDEKTEAFEVIGLLDGAGNKYNFRSFDNQGVYTEMEAELDENGALLIVGDKMRAKLTINNENNLTAHWEKSENNQAWVPWMDLKLSK